MKVFVISWKMNILHFIYGSDIRQTSGQNGIHNADIGECCRSAYYRYINSFPRKIQKDPQEKLLHIADLDDLRLVSDDFLLLPADLVPDTHRRQNVRSECLQVRRDVFEFHCSSAVHQQPAEAARQKCKPVHPGGALLKTLQRVNHHQLLEKVPHCAVSHLQPGMHRRLGVGMS